MAAACSCLQQTRQAAVVVLPHQAASDGLAMGQLSDMCTHTAAVNWHTCQQACNHPCTWDHATGKDHLSLRVTQHGCPFDSGEAGSTWCYAQIRQRRHPGVQTGHLAQV